MHAPVDDGDDSRPAFPYVLLQCGLQKRGPFSYSRYEEPPGRYRHSM